MDNQQLFNVVVSIAGFLAVWVFTNQMQRTQKLEDKLNELPKEYVQKDDYKEDIKEVKENRGYSVPIPQQKGSNTIERIGSNKHIKDGDNNRFFFKRR